MDTGKGFDLRRERQVDGMHAVIVKNVIGLMIMTIALCGFGSCAKASMDTYDPEYEECYLELISDYSEVVPESQWGQEKKEA